MRGLAWSGGGIVCGVLAVLGSASLAEAHMRDYVLTQPYYTAAKGEFEVELYNDFYTPEGDNDATWNSKHQVEVEYGVTNHIQLSYYEVYTWDREKDWERDEFKIEGKVRFAEAGQWPVDVALYTEYANPNGPREARSDALENKVILSKDFGLWNATANFTFERPINERSHWDYEYAVGISREVTPRVRLGLEVQQSLGDSSQFAFDGNHELLVAPGIYANLTKHVRLLVAPVFGATRVSDDFQLRSIMEVEF